MASSRGGATSIALLEWSIVFVVATVQQLDEIDTSQAVWGSR